MAKHVQVRVTMDAYMCPVTHHLATFTYRYVLFIWAAVEWYLDCLLAQTPSV